MPRLLRSGVGGDRYLSRSRSPAGADSAELDRLFAHYQTVYG